MINDNLTCNGAAANNLDGYRSIPVGYYAGIWVVSATVKRLNIAITYTVAC